MLIALVALVALTGLAGAALFAGGALRTTAGVAGGCAVAGGLEAVADEAREGAASGDAGGAASTLGVGEESAGVSSSGLCRWLFMITKLSASTATPPTTSDGNHRRAFFGASATLLSGSSVT